MMGLQPPPFECANALRVLCSRCPAAAREPAVQAALAGQVRLAHTLSRTERSAGPKPGITRRRLRACLQADGAGGVRRALEALLVHPDFTFAAVTLCRPILLSLVVAVVDEAAAAGAGGAHGRPAADVGAALVSTLLLAPHCTR